MSIPESLAQPADRARHIGAVHRISRVLSSTLDLDRRLCDILAVSMEAVGAEAGSILLLRPEENLLEFAQVIGPRAEELTGRTMPAADGVAGEALRAGEARITNEMRNAPFHRADIGESVDYPTCCMVTVPLRYRGGEPVGVMQILNKREGTFTAEDLEVLEIVAAIAGTAIENAHLAREAQAAAVAHAVGNLSHDIKNKMTPISVAVETLAPMVDDAFSDLDVLAANIPPDAASDLRNATGFLRDFIPETFEMIRDQVREVQEYTKLIADALKGVSSEPRLEVMPLGPILAHQLDSLEGMARQRGVTLVRDFDGVDKFRFDRFLIERAVYNLVNNAIPETPEGGTITVRAREEGEEVVIEVADTGGGMPAPVLEKILRGDAKSTKPGGTGLGTRIVYNAVAAHKGEFEGESAEGAGTTFRLRLPRR